MSGPQFTRGPWSFGAPLGQTGPTCPWFGPFCGGEEWPYEQVTSGLDTVAVIPAPDDGDETYCGKPLNAVAVANAHLIAAAPEMYEVLDELLSYTGAAAYALDDEHIVERARAALAKANPPAKESGK